MSRFVSIYVFAVLMVVSGCDSQKADLAKVRLGAWDYIWMKQVKKSLDKGKSEFRPAFDKLVDEAEDALSGGVYSVTFKHLTPPSGSKNDYMSAREGFF